MTDATVGVLNFVGGLFVLLSVRRVLIDRRVAGVSVSAAAFYVFWSSAMLVLFWSVSCWWSFLGGAFVMVANAAYLILLLRFSR